MADPTSNFTQLVPGFDFLQSLVKSTGKALPGIGQWVAPTLDPEELEKRIGELRTVQFWLEQNARLLGATIQALEVQRMTLSTLKGMNLPVGDLGQLLQAHVPGSASARPQPEALTAAPTSNPRAKAAKPAAPAGVVDPNQWWGALTQQFTELAAKAAKESPAATELAGNWLKQSQPAAQQILQPGVKLSPAKPAAKTSPARKTPARKRMSA